MAISQLKAATVAAAAAASLAVVNGGSFAHLPNGVNAGVGVGVGGMNPMADEIYEPQQFDMGGHFLSAFTR